MADTRVTKARRKNVLRVDASVESARREISRVCDIPMDCIWLMKPDGTRARKDKSVRALRRDWGT